MDSAPLDFQSFADVPSIDGVREAKQKRSVRLRQAFLASGIRLLNETRFSDLRIADLSEDVGTSVGSFYARFVDKEAFFRALRVTAVKMSEAEIARRASWEILASMPPEEALDAVVDVMADIFTGEIRGVLRESLLRILEPDDPWAPMRTAARKVIDNMHRGIGPSLERRDAVEARARLSYCFQTVVGVLQNDLVNDYHVYSSRDGSLRAALKETVRAYLRLPTS